MVLLALVVLGVLGVQEVQILLSILVVLVVLVVLDDVRDLMEGQRTREDHEMGHLVEAPEGVNDSKDQLAVLLCWKQQFIETGLSSDRMVLLVLSVHANGVKVHSIEV